MLPRCRIAREPLQLVEMDQIRQITGVGCPTSPTICLDRDTKWIARLPKAREDCPEENLFVTNPSVHAARFDVNIADLFVCAIDPTEMAHGLADLGPSPWLLAKVIPSVVKERKLLYEGIVRNPGPVDRLARGRERAGGSIVLLDGVADGLATSL